MAPWHYPVNLAVVPAIGAIAAGNTVLLKFSRHTSRTARLMCALFARYMDPKRVVAEGVGGTAFVNDVLKLQWDHIFFTGSPAVGKVVYRAAAEFLTPVTLELGGKNPAIILPGADLEAAATKLCFGKFFNGGQTCVGVDYIICLEEQVEPLIEQLKETLAKFYTDNPKSSADYTRVVSSRNYERLVRLIGEAKRVAITGEHDPAQNYVAPTVVVGAEPGSELDTEEIFGPVLLIKPVASLDAAVELVNAGPTPLTLYTFGKSEKVARDVFSRTQSGSCHLNTVLVHFVHPGLPFGGVGPSGIGAYHGDRTFFVFSHERSCMVSSQTSLLPNGSSLGLPPYSPPQALLTRALHMFMGGKSLDRQPGYE